MSEIKNKKPEGDRAEKTREALSRLRAGMAEVGADAVVIPSEDFHDSEYVNDYFKLREHYSGFDGSAGTLLVLEADAYLWTDGRYFLQAGTQLRGTGITLMKQGEPGVPKLMELLRERIREAVGACFTVFMDGRTVSSTLGTAMKNSITKEGGKAVLDRDLAGECWEGRPELKATEIFELPASSTGMTRAEKLADVRAEMAKYSADYLLLSDLMETAWLFNLRASDIDCTPVFYTYTLVGKDSLTLFTLDGALPDDIKAELKAEGTLCCDYNDAKMTVDALPDGSRVWVDLKKTNYAMTSRIALTCDIIDRPTPVEMMKAVKNDVEIASTRNAHLKDAAAVTEFIYWLKQSIHSKPLSELSAAKHLDDLRFSKDGCFDLSFPTISAYADNGAIVHYEPTPETDKALAPEGFLLVDSGGQYMDGTTDITRTIALGPLTDKMKEYYTLVLKSHITLERMRFLAGTTCREIDEVTRKPLNERGLDFNHGTGHGVGHILSVHEGPNFITKGPRAASEMVPGMITSDEPGVYIENEFGIRLENEILCVDETDSESTSGHDGVPKSKVLKGAGSSNRESRVYAFEPLTLVPFEREAIVKDMLTDEEIDWLNSYHQKVYDMVSPLVPKETVIWLKDAAKPL